MVEFFQVIEDLTKATVTFCNQLNIIYDSAIKFFAEIMDTLNKL